MLIEVLVLTFSVPISLFGLMLLLERFETSMVQPDERAAKVVELLHSSDEPEDVERATARMLEAVAPAASGSGRTENRV